MRQQPKFKKINGKLQQWLYIKGTKDWMWIPAKIGHGNKPIWVKPIERLAEHASHTRLKVFYHKGLECVNTNCKNEGKWIIMTVAPGGGLHIDIYTDKFVLMTVDHVIPKSKGGTNHLANKQPMCTYCNSRKCNKMPPQHVVDAVLKEIEQTTLETTTQNVSL